MVNPEIFKIYWYTWYVFFLVPSAIFGHRPLAKTGQSAIPAGGRVPRYRDIKVNHFFGCFFHLDDGGSLTPLKLETRFWGQDCLEFHYFI